MLLGALMMVLVLLPGMAAAQDYPADTTVTTSGCENQYPPSAVCGTQVTVSQGGSSLPFTGGDVALMTVIGLVVVGAGAGLVWVGRRSDARSDATA